MLDGFCPSANDAALTLKGEGERDGGEFASGA